MMSDPWEHDRSRFNHGWLKNQFIASLLKSRQVRSGLVVHTQADADLVMRFREWTASRARAEAVLDQVSADLTRAPHASDAANEAAKLVLRANELERQRWLRDQQPEAALRVARAALVRLDAAVTRALVLAAPGDDEGLLEELLDAASQLSDSFSRLTLSRRIQVHA